MTKTEIRNAVKEAMRVAINRRAHTYERWWRFISPRAEAERAKAEIYYRATVDMGVDLLKKTGMTDLEIRDMHRELWRKAEEWAEEKVKEEKAKYGDGYPLNTHSLIG